MTFTYKYSAAANKEVQEIRKRYLPQGEDKLEELKRLDREVQNAGTLGSLVTGILGCLVFGAAMCMAMNVITGGMALGICLGVVGGAGMLAAYPIYKKASEKAKRRLTPRILELADMLEEKSNF